MRSAWIGALLLALAGAAPAADKPRYSASEVFDRMLAAQASQAWLKATVVKREGPLGASPTAVSRGALAMLPGGVARLDISDPSPGLILSDGKQLWVELPEVSQVLRYGAAKLRESGNFFLDLPSSIRHYSKASQRRLFKPGPDFDAAQVSAVELVPKRPSEAGFERLRVWVDVSRWVVLRVQLDYGGTRSDVRFEDIKTLGKEALADDPAKALDPALFRYAPPKGFEVFDLDL